MLSKEQCFCFFIEKILRKWLKLEFELDFHSDKKQDIVNGTRQEIVSFVQNKIDRKRREKF